MNITERKVIDSVLKNHKPFSINIDNYRYISIQTRPLFAHVQPVISDGHSSATSAATFSVAVAAAQLLFFVTSNKRQCRYFFFIAKKAAALKHPILSKYLGC